MQSDLDMILGDLESRAQNTDTVPSDIVLSSIGRLREVLGQANQVTDVPPAAETPEGSEAEARATDVEPAAGSNGSESASPSDAETQATPGE